MNDFVYRYTCRKCGAVREVRTLRELTADQKRHIRQSDCPVCQLKGIVKGDGEDFINAQTNDDHDQENADVFSEFFDKLTSNMKTLPFEVFEDIAERPWDFV